MGVIDIGNDSEGSLIEEGTLREVLHPIQGSQWISFGNHSGNNRNHSRTIPFRVFYVLGTGWDRLSQPRFTLDRREQATLNGHRLEAAVHDHFGAGDEGAGFVGGEQQGGTDEFVRISEARGRGLAEDVEHAGFIEHLAVLLGGEEAGDEGVDPDVLVRPLAGEVAGEIVDRGLGKRVGEDAGQRIQAGDRSEIDDRCGARFLDEVLSEDLAGAENGGEIGVDDALVFLFRDVEKRGGGIGARAIDQDVHLAGAVEHGVQQVLEGLARGHIDWHKISFSAKAFDFRKPLLGLFRNATAEHDFRTRACQADSHGAAKFAGAADDDGGFA